MPVHEPGTADPEPADATAPAVPQPGGRRAGTRRSRRSLAREIPVLILLALVIAMVIKTFVVQAFFIPSGSMENTLGLYDKVLVNKLVYHFRPIQPGDIVVFNVDGTWNAAPSPSRGSNPLARLFDDTVGWTADSVAGLFGTPIGQTDYVKRVIGVPGDVVACCNARGLVTVNGVPLHEQSYLYQGDRPGSSPPGISGRFRVTVPPGYLWVLGDHRSVSDDSRGHLSFPGNGMIPESKVIGRAFVIAWPPSKWRILPIPATFGQPGVTGAAGPAPYLPAAAGLVAAAIPLAWLRHRKRHRAGARTPFPFLRRALGRARGRG
jgi:signal peptidase I